MEELHHLNHAEGWLELGDHQSASDELDKLSPEFKTSALALGLRLRIYMVAKKWPQAEALARSLLKRAPFAPGYSVFLAESLHNQGRNREAFEVLSNRLFLNSLDVAYYAACYACEAGEIKQGLFCLERAIAIGHALKSDIRLKALDEPLLKKLWSVLAED